MTAFAGICVNKTMMSASFIIFYLDVELLACSNCKAGRILFDTENIMNFSQL